MKIKNKGFLVAALIMLIFGAVMLYFRSIPSASIFIMFAAIIAIKKGLSF